MEKHTEYWHKNLQIIGTLLGIWAAVTFGASIFLVDTLNTIKIGGFKLGFWFAQQGSIYVFVVLIFIYIWQMNRLDAKFGYNK